MSNVAGQSVVSERSIWAQPSWAHWLMPTPVPFCLSLKVVDSQTVYFVERGQGRVFAAALLLIPAVFALTALLMVIEVVIDREESFLASGPEAITGFALMLCFIVGVSGLAAWAYCHSLRRTRELAGERFVVAGLKKREDVEAHFQKLPGMLRALWRGEPRPNECESCGYDLRGLAVQGRVCPECGVEG